MLLLVLHLELTWHSFIFVHSSGWSWVTRGWDTPWPSCAENKKLACVGQIEVAPLVNWGWSCRAVCQGDLLLFFISL